MQNKYSKLVPYELGSRLPFDVILTHIFFWVNPGKNADPYIIKLPSLSSTRECDDEPELFS